MAIMKCISIWQPWASLKIKGIKRIETRGWPAPASLIGQRMGIASTARLKLEQVKAFKEPNFARHYAETGLPADLTELPFGKLLGTSRLVACEPHTQAFVNGLTPAEFYFGWYAEGRWAWIFEDDAELPEPVPVRGKQGLWEVPDELVLGGDPGQHR